MYPQARDFGAVSCQTETKVSVLIESRGGNDPAIVCEDVDLMTVVPQVCFFPSRMMKTKLTHLIKDCAICLGKLRPGRLPLNINLPATG
jgi:hypothetical protein